MSAGIRGSEVDITMKLDGIPLKGSFRKIEDFEATPRMDLIETDFAGERATDLDTHMHGWDVSFSVREEDHRVIDMLTDLITRDEAAKRPPVVTLTVLYTFREPGAEPRTEVYRQGVVKIERRGFQSRKDYVKANIVAKFKKRDVINA